jgi:predicted ATPase/DNA-binding SARP family transcriptional activator
MRFGVLGPLEVVAGDGETCDPSAGRQRRLLLALLVLRDGAVDVDRLADIVWSQDEGLPQHPAAAVRTYIARLRRVLEPEGAGGEPSVLVGGPDRFRLVLDGHELDAAVFEAELEQASALVAVDAQAALEVVEGGLGRWRGRALAEVADEGWAQPDAVRLEELRLAAQELRSRCLLDLGRHGEVLADLERAVREHPLRERPHGQLMVALHRCGRSGEATEVFRGLRDRLVEELGLDPSAELERMHQRLLEGDDPEGTATPVTASGVFNTLPEPRTPLVGRDEHVDGIVELVGSARVVTLTGVGGVGKTRLALAVAHRIRGDGGQVVFVDLSVVTDAGGVVDAVFAALRLPAAARTGHLDALVRVLRAHPVLLVLDNCEHVLDAVAALVDRTTSDCPELTVLATSREAIGIDGEHTCPVPSLALDAGVELFTSRATAARSGGGPAAQDRDAVAEICRRLDGIPLAIELAAARTSHLTPAAIAERLDDRFWLLAGGRRALGRHQTLQATMDWSYDLLEEEQQAVLRAAAVFVGGFDAPALAAVSGRSEHDTLDRLATLVRSSLVEVDHTGGEPRYRLLETVRLYAQDRLADAGELAPRRRTHAHHFLARALAHPPRFDDLPEWGATVEDDTDLGNDLAALDWFDRQDARVEVGRLAARIPTVLGFTAFVDAAGRYLGREEIDAALDDPDERALYLTASATNASYLGRFRDQLELGQAAWEAASDPVVHAAATIALANACTIFDPQRIPGLVDDALADLPPSAKTLRQDLRGQLPLGLVMEGRLAEAAELLQGLMREGARFRFAAAELMLVLHLLGEQQQALAVPRPGDLDPQDALWDYRWSLVRALAAATEQRFEVVGQHLADAANQIRSTPIQLLDHDLLLGYAALAYHTGDHHRASEILATFRGVMRSPASFALYVHYRDLLKTQLAETERTQILQRATHLDPAEILERELARTPTTRHPQQG